MRFNTAISAMMVFVNEAISWTSSPWPPCAPFCNCSSLSRRTWPRNCGEIERGFLRALAYAPWPKYDPALLVETEIEIPVQVNGKFRDVIRVAADADNATIEAAAKASEKVQQFIGGKPSRNHHRAQADGEYCVG